MSQWFFLLVLVATGAFSQGKVIQLHYLQVEQAVQLIQPLLEENDKVGGSGQTLVIKANSSTILQIREMLHKVDVPPVTFTVSVYQGDPEFLSVQNNNSIVYSTQPQSEKQRSQSVKVMNGSAAYIDTNEEMPIVSSVGVGLFTGVDYQQHQVKNGFWVQPTLQGDQVKLTIKKIREQISSAGGQQFDNQQVNTTVMVPMNKWVLLGSAEGAQPVDNSSITLSAGRSYSQNSSLYIKVSLVNAFPSGETK